MSSIADQDEIDPRVNLALQEFLEFADRGEFIDREQFLAKHAEIADQLRSFITDSDDLVRRVVARADVSAEVSTNRSLAETLTSGAPGGTPALPEVFGRYRVNRLLGKGAMGAVYLAQDTQLSRQVALKVPSFGNDQSNELLERFYREARAAATLRNPHICPVYDVGEISGQHYISMAYIEGHPLSDVIKSNGPLSERQALLLVRKLALALQEAHDEGVIHRDLKPGNVMIDSRGEPVIMDFGLACQTRDTSARLTSSGVILGSPAYMSPQQLEGDSTRITAAADQYGLGVILYELLTGELPFRGSIPMVISQILTRPAPSPRLVRGQLDPRVDELCQQMLAKTPAERLESMKAVADRILAILKEPPKPEQAAIKSSAPSAEPITATFPPVGVNGQQQIMAAIKKGDLEGALVLLEPLAARPTGKLTDWARQQQTQLRERLEQRKGVPTLCLVAAKLIRKHDYAEACRVLSSVPSSDRSEELNDLLADAEAKNEEVGLLMKDIEQAIRKNQPEELPKLVKRYLQLKPGNKAMLALSADLRQYGAERVIRLRRNQRDFLDPAGPIWNPLHIAAYVAGLALLCVSIYLAAIAFATPNGTVIVEVYDPNLIVSFANNEITAASSGKKFTLRTTDKKTLELMIDGVKVEASSREITVEKNETKLITARLVDGEVLLQINSEKKTFQVPEKAVASTRLGRTESDMNAVGLSATPGWIDLLKAVDLKAASATTLRWTRDESKLVGTRLSADDIGWASVIFPQEIEGDYDMEIDYLISGTNLVSIALPLNETNVSVSLTESGSGLHWIDRKETPRNVPSPHANPDAKTQKDLIQHFTASVRHNGNDVTVEAKLDGRTVGRYSGPRSRLTVEIASKNRRLAVVTYFPTTAPGRRIEVQKAQVRLLNPPAPLTVTPDGWTEMFNGKDLTGWDGDATFWGVKDGAIVSRVDTWTKPVYLLSTKEYSQFELRLQFRLMNEGNSGVQYRTMKHQTDAAGRGVYGHQAEIGFINVPGRPVTNIVGDICGQGMDPPTVTLAQGDEREAINKIYRHRDWNQLVIRCEGRHETVELNGVKTAEIHNSPSPDSGRIGFQLFDKAEIEFRDVRVRSLAAPDTSAATPVVSPPVVTPPSAKVLLDVDFRKSSGGFALGDDHHILAEHKDGEYRYLGKKVGWWYNGLHPVFWEKENNQLHDFTIEVDVRLVGKKKGMFAIEFGRLRTETLTLFLNQAGQLGMLDGTDEFVAAVQPTAMRPVDQFNTIRLTVQDKMARAFVNGELAFEKRLDGYAGSVVSLWLGPEEVPFDVRLQRVRLEIPAGSRAKHAKEELRLKGHTDLVRAIAFLPDSQRAVSVGHSQAFKLWDLKTGQLLHDFVGHSANVTSVSVSADGRRALTGCDDGHVRLWDLEARTLLKTLKGHTKQVVSVLLSGDGTTGLSASIDGMIRRWDLKAGGKSNILLGSDATWPTLAMSPDEKVIATGHWDGPVFVRSAKGIAPLIGHVPGEVEGVAFVPDGSKLVTGGTDGTVRLWDLKSGQQIHRFDTDSVGLNSVAVTSNGRFVIAGSGDQTIRGWDLQTGDSVVTIHADMPVTHRLALSPDNQHVLSGGGDRHWKLAYDYDLRLWKLPSPPAPMP